MSDRPRAFRTTAAALGVAGRSTSLEEIGAAILGQPRRRWAAYLAGCWPVLATARSDIDLSGGASLLLVSEVPSGAGVSSSAAIEVATMRVLSEAHGVSLDGLELARLCQIVENRVVGAPCGIMDQVTSAMGRENELLALLCQPHEILDPCPIPTGFRVTGLDSGVKHSVAGSAYARARVAAFMGHRIVTDGPNGDFLNGYLANLSPDRYLREFRDLLPESMTGREFLDRYQATIDPVTTIDPDETYTVRSCAEHPILENDRVTRFRDLLLAANRSGDADPAPRGAIDAMKEAGALMFESHASYGDNCGLGSEETDFLVEAARRIGPERGLYGAKITGGGGGGTVAILMDASAPAEIAFEEVRKAYRARTSILTRRFVGSSPGAMSSPVLNLPFLSPRP